MPEQTPATPPAVWWSETTERLYVRTATDPDVWTEHYLTMSVRPSSMIFRLPADAVRLVPDPAGADPARTLLADILAIVNRHRGSAASANEAMQEIEDAISTSMDALAIRAASPSGDTGERPGTSQLTPDCDLGVCPHEDCPYEREPDQPDCGNHEEWMT